MDKKLKSSIDELMKYSKEEKERRARNKKIHDERVRNAWVEEEIGMVDVDAGLIYLGDPCYQSDKSDFKPWSKFCKFLDFEDLKDTWKLNHEAGHEGKGVVVSSGYGDGSYPVFIKRNKDGRIAEVTIKFIEKDE